MKLNVFKILNVVSMFMELAEGFKAAKSGPEKLDYVLDHSDELLAGAEGLVGKDLLKDARLRPFAEKYIAAAKELVNEAAKLKVISGEVVGDLKGLKADPTPAA